MKNSIKLSVVLFLLASVVQVSQAAYVFADWNTRTANSVAGTINGIAATYCGEVAGATQVGNTGPIDYWLEFPGQPLRYT